MRTSLPENRRAAARAGLKLRISRPEPSLEPAKAIRPPSRRSRTRLSDVPIVIIAVGIYFISSTTGFVNYDLLVYTFTGAGGIVLAILLLRSDLAPLWLSLLGGIGYAVLLIGVASDLLGMVDFDSPIRAVFYVPGAVFEITFPFPLIFRGFGSRHAPVLEASE